MREFIIVLGIQEKLGILNSGEVYAVFSYEAQQNDELSFTINDKLTILRKGDDAEREWWWAKNLNNVEGYVPRNLLGVSKMLFFLFCYLILNLYFVCGTFFFAYGAEIWKSYQLFKIGGCNTMFRTVEWNLY